MRAYFVITLAAAVPAAAQPGPHTIASYGVSIAGAGATGYGLAPASLFSDGGRPVAAYGVAQTRTRPIGYSYYIVFKADPAARAEFRTGGEQTAADATVTAAVHVGGKERWRYRFEFASDEATGTVTKEVLTAGGKEFKLADARVLLVDLTADPPTCTAVKAAPPTAVPPLAGGGGSLEVAAKAAARIRADAPAVKAFLAPGGGK